MFINFFRSTVEKIMLGRWNCTDVKLNKIKAHLANIDHCGTCTLKPVKVRRIEAPLKKELGNSTKNLPN
jgi:hypothetical protein